MPRAMTVEVYKFEELSDKAKERARDWWRECENESFGDFAFQSWYEDWERVAECLGVEFKQHRVVPMGGEKFARMEPNIYWSLHTQGSGVAFEAIYSHKKGGALKALKKYAPQDEKLADIAANLDNLQRANAYLVTARITHSGNYTHEYSMDYEFERMGRSGRDLGITEETAKAFAEQFQALSRWYHEALQNEYTYAMSDENVDSNIECNDYEFDVSGKRTVVI